MQRGWARREGKAPAKPKWSTVGFGAVSLGVERTTFWHRSGRKGEAASPRSEQAVKYVARGRGKKKNRPW